MAGRPGDGAHELAVGMGRGRRETLTVHEEFDYIIVGAGAAGCVLANRLSANPKHRVLLLEAGGPDSNPFIHMPKGISKVMGDPDYIWPYAITPEPGSNDAAESWARGRTLGGSSSINGLVYVRGQAADYDELAALTSADWDWAHMGKAYSEIENHELGRQASRGAAGPLHITMPPPTPLTQAAIEAAVAMGVPRREELNDPANDERIGFAPRTIYKGRRQSAAVAFLDPVSSRKNLVVQTRAVADRVVIENGRAVAVEVITEGARRRISAVREVILAAGALATPGVLQRSGIGPRTLLDRIGIECQVERREVGLNLREHRGIVMQWRVRDDLSQNREYQGARLVANTARYYLRHDGPMSGAAYEVGAWIKSRPELPRPDGQILIAPFTFDYTSPTFSVESHGGMNFCVYMLRPASSGSYAITSQDPEALPEIRANYASDPEDLRKMLDLMRIARRLAAQAPLSQYVLEETRPGAKFQSDEELLEAYRACGYGCYHASGTCRMGNDAESVVDPNLRVRGVHGLRVADTSIFPFMLSGNTAAPAMAMAWRAADLILADNAQVAERGAA